MQTESIKIGKRGSIVIPSSIRKKCGFEEGSIITVETTNDGKLVLSPAVTIPVEHYSDERIAEFLLSNAIDKQDYESARQKVSDMGLNPDETPHYSPEK